MKVSKCAKVFPTSTINGELVHAITVDRTPRIITLMRRPALFMVPIPANSAEASELMDKLVSAAISAGCYWEEQ